MVRHRLRDEQWSRAPRVLLSQRRTGRRGRDDRNFIEAVPWWRRTGVPWRDLPEEFGSWKTVFYPSPRRLRKRGAVREDLDVQREVVDIEPLVIEHLHSRHVGRC